MGGDHNWDNLAVSMAFKVCRRSEAVRSLRAHQSLSRHGALSRTRSRPLFPFFGVEVAYNPLKTKKDTLFIPRLLLGLGFLAQIPRSPNPELPGECGGPVRLGCLGLHPQSLLQ